jgi:hypothetical protein
MIDVYRTNKSDLSLNIPGKIFQIFHENIFLIFLFFPIFIQKLNWFSNKII